VEREREWIPRLFYWVHTLEERGTANQPFSTRDDPYINSLRAIADNLQSVGTDFRASYYINDERFGQAALDREELYFGARPGVSPLTSREVVRGYTCGVEGSMTYSDYDSGSDSGSWMTEMDSNGEWKDNDGDQQGANEGSIYTDYLGKLKIKVANRKLCTECWSEDNTFE
jgi:hypothetical protein